MVISSINNKINYNETKSIHKDDIDYKTSIFNGDIYGKKIAFVLGKPKFDYITNNIIYFYIYLVKNNKEFIKIGLYECNDKYSNILDESNEIIIEKLDKLLLFSFTPNLIKQIPDINKEQISEYKKTKEKDDEKDEEKNEEKNEEKFVDYDKNDDDDDNNDNDDNDDNDDDDDDKKDKTQEIIKPLDEQSKEDAYKEYESYIKNESHNWIAQYLQTTKYTIHDNEGGGDCFFAVLRDALEFIGKNVSVAEIRKELSRVANDAIFDSYKSRYNQFYKFYKDLNETKKESKEAINSIKLKLKSSFLLTSDKAILLDDAKKHSKIYKESVDDIKNIKNNLDELEFMKNIDTLDKFKKVILTNKYWADEWAISNIEKIYNVKFIILSKINYEYNDKDNVVQCGIIDDSVFKNIDGTYIDFKPDYYIITSYEGNIHYKLVKYLDRSLLTFKELPYIIKEYIVNKCLENLSGMFSLINDFIVFKDNISTTYKSHSEGLKTIDHSKDDIKQDESDQYQIPIKSKSLTQDVDIFKNLYNSNTTFVIHKRAADTAPGKNTSSGEKIDTINFKSENINELKKIKDWRKKLDNSYEAKDLIVINDKSYTSIDDFIKVNKLNKKSIDQNILEKLYLLKFNNINYVELKKILILTDNALLMQYTPKIGLDPLNLLMKIRKTFL